MPDRTIALTFEDGPDPRWTPRILDVLRKHNVHATFFVVGANAMEHPALTRGIVAEGHEIGSHGFTHADLAGLPGWRRKVELGLTQQTLAGVASDVSEDTLAEDTDLTMAICRAGRRVVYEEKARAWTEAPSSVGQLRRQRYRWCYGTLQAMWKHRRALVQRGSAGIFGRRGLTYLWLFQYLLPRGGCVRAVLALRLDGESLKPLWTIPLQQLFYRQFMYVVVVQSIVTAVLGTPRSVSAAAGRPPW